MGESAPTYLQPYLQAAQRHGGGFGSLLWASPRSQAARFSAIARIIDTHRYTMLDAGCGRADLLDYLAARGAAPKAYIGIEAVDAVYQTAAQRELSSARIIHDDFVKNPSALDAGADVIVFCGSLNTLSGYEFAATVQAALRCARVAVVFNFLSSPFLASAPHLSWRRPRDVAVMFQQPDRRPILLEDYLRGDATICFPTSERGV